jgi:tRNA G18 (ribose-2'-O)-methylase SpoU
MFTVQAIESFDLPELTPYRTMRLQHEHRVERIFVAEGEKIVRRLLESRLGVVSVLLPHKWVPEFAPLLAHRPEHIRVFVAEKELLETLTGFTMYQGLLAVGQVPDAITLETALAMSPRPHLLAAVDGLTNAENLGSLVRNCVAFGVQTLLVGETCSSPYLRRAVRASMGTVFELPLVETTDLAAALLDLRSRGVRGVAAHPHADRRPIAEANFAAECCLVFGSEGYGISPRVLAACAQAAAIPMPAHVDSLNVGSAAAVFLYEACRQRGKMGNVKRET